MPKKKQEEIHPTAQRLYAAAKDMLNLSGKSAIANLLGEHPQTLNNWEGPRGVSEGGALKAQAKLGCDANWLLTGAGSSIAGWPFSKELRGAVARLDAGQLAIAENVIRAALSIPVPPPPTAPPPAGTPGSQFRRTDVLPEQLHGSSRKRDRK